MKAIVGFVLGLCGWSLLNYVSPSEAFSLISFGQLGAVVLVSFGAGLMGEWWDGR